jgi:hypothetical protein
MTIDRKRILRAAFGLAAAGVAVLAMPSVAFAQEAAARASLLRKWALVRHRRRPAIWAAGIGRSAVESMARQRSGRPDFDGDDYHRRHIERDAVRGRRRHDGVTQVTARHSGARAVPPPFWTTF